MNEFKTPHNQSNFPKIKEPIDGELLTEVAGYIPANIRIENIINAGERLRQARAEMYDFGPNDEIDEDFQDPTRSKSFDLADASVLKENLDMRYREIQKQKKVLAEKAKSTKKVQNTPQESKTDEE